MKIKTSVLLFLFAFCLVKANAQAIPFGAHFRPVTALDRFSINYMPCREMAQVFPTRKGAELPVHRAYVAEKGKYEVWYTLFAEIGTGKKNTTGEYMLYMLNCASLVAGRNITMAEITALNAADVKKNFGADLGYSCFLQLPKSAYAKGFAYVQLHFFYRQGQGFVMRAFLTNDLKTLTAPAKSYKSAFNSFKFIQ